MKLEIFKLSGVGQGSWSIASDFEAMGGKKVLVVALRVKGEEGVSLGRQLMVELEEKWRDLDEVGVGEIKDLLGLEKKMQLALDEKVELLVAMLEREEKKVRVCLGGKGGGGVWIRKRGKVGKLVGFGEEERVICGEIEEGDLIAIANEEVFAWLQMRPEILKEGVGQIGESLNWFRGKGVSAALVEVQVGGQIGRPVLEMAVERKKGKKFGEWIEKMLRRKDAPIHISEGKDWHVGGYRSKKGVRIVRIVAVILLMALGVGLVVGGKQRKQQVEEMALVMKLEEAKVALDEGRNLALTDVVGARSAIAKARDLAMSLEKDTKYAEEAGRVLAAVTEVKEEILGEVVRDPKVYIDLSLVRDGMTGKVMAMSLGNLIVGDTAGYRMVRVEVESKATSVVGGGGKMEGLSLVAAYGERGFGLVDSGIVESGKKEAVIVIEKKGWTDLRAISAYGGNLYMLSETENMIWRSSGTEVGFGEAKEWLAPDSEVDLSGAVDMAIDGGIWVLKTQGRVLKLVYGIKDIFGIDVEGDVQFDKIDTNEDAENIYLLNRAGKRVVVVDKKGKYKKQYLWEQMAIVDDLAVDEKTGKLFLLSGSKIWLLEL